MAYEKNHLELLKAAAALFARRGYHKATIRDLARATGRSLSGLYYYFSGKDELLYQIQHHCYSTLHESTLRVLEPIEAPQDRLIAFISHHITFFRHNMDEMKVLAHEDVTLTGKLGEGILELKRRYSGLLVDVLADCEKELPEAPDRPSPEVAAFILFGAMNWLYTWPRRLRQRPADELAAAVAQIFLNGYPGCPGSPRTGMRESILCSPQNFWKGMVLPGPRTGTE